MKSYDWELRPHIHLSYHHKQAMTNDFIAGENSCFTMCHSIEIIPNIVAFTPTLMAGFNPSSIKHNWKFVVIMNGTDLNWFSEQLWLLRCPIHMNALVEFGFSGWADDNLGKVWEPAFWCCRYRIVHPKKKLGIKLLFIIVKTFFKKYEYGRQYWVKTFISNNLKVNS